MVKKIGSLFFFVLMFVTAMADGRTGKMKIAGETCEYDTMIHRKIGPGMTYTQFQFNMLPYQGRSYKMRVHLVKMDVTNQHNALKPYLAKDKYHAVNTQVQQYAVEMQKGNKPLASINAMAGFVQSNGASATSKAYEVCGSCIIDGELRYEARGYRTNFYFDRNKMPHIANAKMVAKAKSGTKEVAILQVNHCRDLVDGAKGATLFCNGYGTTFSTNNNIGKEVVVKRKTGKAITVGDNECTIVRVMNGSGSRISDGEAVISATGASADILAQMAPGDDITISVGYENEAGELLNVVQQTSTFGYGQSIENGNINLIDVKNYAIPAMGISQDGKTVYMADLEISTYSNAPDDCLTYFLANIGVWNALWCDGGPSAEMTVDGKWVTTNSIGYGFNGRYIPGGSMVYSTAPDDVEISSLEVLDPTPKKMNVGESIDISVYAFNKYDEMICENIQKSDLLDITSPEGLGEWRNGRFYALKEGRGSITISLRKGGASIPMVTIPLWIIKEKKLIIKPKKVFTGEFREVPVELEVIEDGITSAIESRKAKWSTHSKYVIKSCTNGVIVPCVDGIADVYADFEGLRDTLQVTVENVGHNVVKSIDFTNKIESQSMYDVHLTSVPRNFEASFVVNPNITEDSLLVYDDTVTVALYYQTGDSIRMEYADVEVGKPYTMQVVLDYYAADTYPVRVLSATSSKNNSITLTNLTAYYGAPVKGDANNDGMVDIADVNAIISVICGGGKAKLADVNEDGIVDIADVNAVIGIICGSN